MTTTLMTPDFVSRLQARDRDAFAELYQRYKSTLIRYAFNHGADSATEDIVSTTFERAWNGIDRYQPTGVDIGAWLIRICRNLLFDHFKSANVRTRWPRQIEPEDRPVHVVDTFDPHSAAESAHARSVLMAALGLLNNEQQAALKLRFLAELSVAETAQVMGISEGAVKALTYRARLAMLRHVQEWEN